MSAPHMLAWSLAHKLRAAMAAPWSLYSAGVADATVDLLAATAIALLIAIPAAAQWRNLPSPGPAGPDGKRAVVINAVVVTAWLRHDLARLPSTADSTSDKDTASKPVACCWVAVYLGLLAGVIANAHHAVLFLSVGMVGRVLMISVQVSKNTMPGSMRGSLGMSRSRRRPSLFWS